MRRLWYLFVLVLATMLGLPANAVAAPPLTGHSPLSHPALAKAQEEKASYPNIESKKVAATELTDLLSESHGATLKDVTITGNLHLPKDLEYLEGDYVRLDGNLDATAVTKATLRFRNSTFNDSVTFYQSRVREVDFRSSELKGRVNFVEVSAIVLSLYGSILRDEATFAYSTIRELSLFDVTLQGYTDFTSATFGSIVVTQLYADAPILIDGRFLREGFDRFERWVLASSTSFLRVDDERIRRANVYESVLRFWKNNFERVGRPRDALEINRRLIVFHAKHVSRFWQLEWWLAQLLDILTGYGTHPYRLFWISCLIVLIYGIVYNWRKNVFYPTFSRTARHNRERILFSILYSLHTFLPLIKVIDDKKWPWRISLKYRWLELSEKTLGLVIVALGAYSLKYIL